MPRKPAKRKPNKKRSRSKKNHAYEIVQPTARLVSSPLAGLLQPKEGAILSVLLLVSLALLTSQFFTTDRFYVYEPEVHGNQFVGLDEIRDASDLYTLSIFWVKPDQVEADIADLPGVKEVRVTCRLPNRVRIEIVERQMQIIWLRGDQRYSVDDRGVLLTLEGESEGMLLIEEVTDPLEVDDRIDPEVIRSAMELRRLLPEMDALQYSEDKGLILRQADYPVHLGTGDMAKKVAILNALCRDFSLEGIQPEYVDMRFIEGLSYKSSTSAISH